MRARFRATWSRLLLRRAATEPATLASRYAHDSGMARAIRLNAT
jgi:hypothetical protein